MFMLAMSNVYKFNLFNITIYRNLCLETLQLIWTVPHKVSNVCVCVKSNICNSKDKYTFYKMERSSIQI